MPTSGLASTSSAPIGRNKMLGFDDDLIAIKARLCGESSRLQIIPIVGMGGIGKTTLAGNIFDDSLVAYHFHVRAWITMSQKYHLREILIGLLDSLHLDTKDSSSKRNEVLMEDVYKTLKGRTYLIVMDDLWITEAWDDLRRFFPDDNNGSRIIITTRLTHVAEYVSCSPIHQMHFLSEDQSWNLLRDEVFANQLCPPKLEKIGRIIARKCGLLPLAITVVAGILKKVELTQYRWRQVAKNIGLSMANADVHLSKVLSVSYDHLPHHLKACFLYMGGFPEDYEIPVSKLIKLWVAEGFLKPLESKSLEEVAEDYLEDLVRRNLVLVKKKSSNGKFKLCGVHDLLRDLCIHKAQEENFLRVFDMNSYYLGKTTPTCRRLTNHAGFYMGNVIEHACTSTIRSVLYFDCGERGFIFGLLHLKMLRVLHILEVEFRSFPVEITELFHLRYLAFTYDHDTRHKFMVPPSISKLQNLQTLIMLPLSPPYITPSLPFEIWKIPKLRHVVSEGDIPLPRRNGGPFP